MYICVRVSILNKFNKNGIVSCADTSSPRKSSSSSSKVKVLILKSCYSVKFLSCLVEFYFILNYVL